MSTHSYTDKRIDHLFSISEAQGICLHVKDRNNLLAVRRRLLNKTVLTPARGLYVRSNYWHNISQMEKTRHLIRTYSQLYPTWIFSHASAAIMYDLQVSRDILQPFHFQTSRSNNSKGRKGFIHHRTNMLGGHPVDGALVTPLEQTVIDCAAYYSFKYGLAIADSALHSGQTNKEKLSSIARRNAHKRGIRRAQKVILHADSLSDNGGESIVRATMLEAHLPQPELQVAVPNLEKPGHFYYVDFMFTTNDGSRVAVELDGLEKYQNLAMTQGRETTQIMIAERQREAAITAQGIRVARFTFSQASNKSFLINRLKSYGIYPLV